MEVLEQINTAVGNQSSLWVFHAFHFVWDHSVSFLLIVPELHVYQNKNKKTKTVYHPHQKYWNKANSFVFAAHWSHLCSDQMLNMRIAAFISWYLHQSVSNYSDHGSFDGRSPNFQEVKCMLSWVWWLTWPIWIFSLLCCVGRVFWISLLLNDEVPHN